MIGRTLGKYRILEQIGRGGMAEVYKAYHPGLDRYVAVKLMHSFLAKEEGFLERFRREAQSVARLRHSNIVHMYDFDVQDDVYYMVMEFLEGPSLKNKLKELESQGEWLTLEQAVCIVRDVGQALDYAHQRDMIHRDIKPANIMLTESGGAILTDFGIVKMLGADTQLTASGALVGTPAFMAPEQSMGAPGDERSDIYSLGIVLYQLVTGQLPYDADTPMAIILQHINAPLPIPTSLKPEVPAGIERVILKTLAKDPQDRYQSVRDMLNHLDQAMQGQQVPAIDPAITSAAYPMGAGATPPPAAGAPPDALAPPAPRPNLFSALVSSLKHRWPWWGGFAVSLLVTVYAVLSLFGFFQEDVQISSAVTLTPTRYSSGTSAPPTATSTPRPSHTPDLIATEQRAFFATRLSLTATGPPSPTPTPTPTATPTPSPTPTSRPTSTPTPTPDLTATQIAACTFDAALDRHVTLWPGQYLAPGQAAKKSWRVRNSGDCPWPSGTLLILVDGDQLGAPDSVEIDSIAPDETLDISLDIYAPNSNGSYAATWQLQIPDGDPFGEALPIQINVGPTPTPRPTWTPTATPTPLATPTPAEALNMSVPILWGECWRNSTAGTWGGTLVWSAFGGTGEYEYYFHQISPENKLPGPSYNFDGQVDKPWGGRFWTVSGADSVFADAYVSEADCGW